MKRGGACHIPQGDSLLPWLSCLAGPEESWCNKEIYVLSHTAHGVCSFVTQLHLVSSAGDRHGTKKWPSHPLSMACLGLMTPPYLGDCLIPKRPLLPPGDQTPQVMWGGSAQSLGQKSPSGLQMLVALSSLYTCAMLAAEFGEAPTASPNRWGLQSA